MLNIFVADPGWNLGFSIATKVVGIITYGLSSSALEEKEALYNLKVLVEQNLVNKFTVDTRILEDKCGATNINFDLYKTPKYFYSDQQAPYHVTFNHLINQFGTNDKDGEDNLMLYIYSDYLRKMMRFPKFPIKNNEILYFDQV